MKKSIGMLFKGDMVRAILAGKKTHTRRPITRLLGFGDIHDLQRSTKPDYQWSFFDRAYRQIELTHAQLLACCPYGRTGDEIWVRETWQGPLLDDRQVEKRFDSFESPEYCVYAADGAGPPEFFTADDKLVCRWQPSIHMPRWASRIVREVLTFNAGALLEVTDCDALLEGMNPDCKLTEPSQQFRNLIYQLYPHAGLNPWLWDIEFSTESIGA